MLVTEKLKAILSGSCKFPLQDSAKPSNNRIERGSLLSQIKVSFLIGAGKTAASVLPDSEADVLSDASFGLFPTRLASVK